ncbi:MAG: deoxyribodipyrimidine photo-lyase [Rhodothermales bacterium]|nr:deoxyribodipyrimidine photo-lyase [Rhodothermales bacterium]
MADPAERVAPASVCHVHSHQAQGSPGKISSIPAPMHPTLVWFENDLRLHDHPALEAAARGGAPIVPLFVWNGGDGWGKGAASQWWLHHSLVAFSDSLADVGLSLVVRRGDPETIVPEVARSINAGLVTWLERPDTARAERDSRIEKALECPVRRFGGALLHDPEQIRTGSGGPYKVFTPFYRKFAEEVAVEKPSGVAPLDGLESPPSIDSESIDSLGLLPTIPWDEGLAECWTPGEAGARSRLADLELEDYAEERDIPSIEGTSRLSPHLHFGEVSPREVWHVVGNIEPYRRQLVWRDFAHHLIHHFPETRDRPLRKEFESFPWRRDDEELARWQKGQTGYPIVDAGMRQLWHTGWMHNRVRMVVASFLTKHLLHTWLDGQAWFEDTLVDADLANNVFGWQWAGGCGADAQPFFRIFNPMTQGKKFDPKGAYVRKWVPELADLPNKVIHEPWTADNVPENYPAPIVDHKEARERALSAYQKTRN